MTTKPVNIYYTSQLQTKMYILHSTHQITKLYIIMYVQELTIKQHLIKI